MNRYRCAPVLMLFLGILPGFAANRVQKIAPKNRFQYSAPGAWAKAATHTGATEKHMQPGQAGKSNARAAAKSTKQPAAAIPLRPTPVNLPTGKLGLLSATQIPVGGGIYNSGVTSSGDFTGNGKVDLITQVENDRNTSPVYSIVVALSNGDGTFQAPVLTPTPGNDNCSTLAVGDLNGDGKDDLIVIHQSACSGGTSSIDVMIGNGDGTFTLGTNYPITNTNLPGGVLADTTGDGKLDIVLVDEAVPAKVWTLLGNGNGTFQAKTSVTLSGTSGNGPTFSDLNGDGLLDIAEMDSDTNELTIYLATSPTAYATAVSYPSSDGVEDACSLTVGDLTGDGKGEAVNANCQDDTLTVYVNDGDGTFQNGVYYAAGLSAPDGTTADLYPGAVSIADVNGDGKADIISSNENSSDLTILLGNGDGTVTVPSIGYAVGGFPGQPAIVADFNRDGYADLVVPNLDFSLVFFKGYGDGTFRSALDYYAPIIEDTPDGVTVATGDFNGDGNPDFVMGNCCGAQAGITVFLSRADGSLMPGVNYVSANATQELQYVAVGDFNQDGKLDIAAADSDNGAVQIFNGVGDGTFTLGSSLTSGLYEDQPTAILVGDFKNNGIPDIAVANINDGTQDIAVLINDGTGTFASAVTYNLSNSFNDVGIAAVSLRSNGTLDLIVPITFGNVVAILLGNGDGTFQAEADLSIPSTNPFAVAVGDFSGDGKPDLAITLTYPGTEGVAVALGNGDGTFQTPVIYPSSLQDMTFSDPVTNYIQTADVDGDGKLDLVYANSNYGTVGILYGIGDGTFYSPVEFAAGGFVYGLTVADVNHDGTPDVVAAGDDFAGLSVLLNLNGAGTQSNYGVATSTPTITVSAGGAAVYDLTIAPANHYNGLVTMSCGTLPLFTTCSFSPASFRMDGHSSVAVRLTVTTTAVGASSAENEKVRSQRESPLLFASLGGIGLLGMILCSPRKRNSRLLALLLALLAIPTLLSLTGCGKDCDDNPSACQTLTSGAAATTAAVTSSLNPVVAGQTVTFTGKITSSGGTPTGTVTFLDGTTKLGIGTLASGAATYATSSLIAGSHSITVSYAGDPSFKASVSPALSEAVDHAGTPPGTYTIPINATGTAGSNSGNTGLHSLTVRLTVR